MELSVEDGSSSLDSTAGTAVHYERMLSQVHELQEDLTKTLSVAQRLRSENSALREKYDEAVDGLDAQKKKYSELRTAYLQQAEALIDAEREREAQETTSKQLVQQMEAKIDELQQQSSLPQDLNVLRVKVQEELEGPHQEQIRQMEETIEKTRSLYFSSKRDAELARNELEQALEDAARDAEATEAAHSAQLQGLQRSMAAAQAEYEQKSSDWGEQLRQQTLQTDAALARARKLDAALQEAARKANQAHAESTKVQAEAKSARVQWVEQKNALEKSVKQLTSEVQAAKAIVERQRTAAAQRTEQLQQSQRSHKMDTQAAVERHNSLKQELAACREQAERDLTQRQSEAVQLREALGATRAQLQSAQERVRQLESSAMVSARQNSQTISSLQRKLEQAEAGEARIEAQRAPPLQPGMCITSEEELDTFQKAQTDLQSKLAASQTELRQANAQMRCLRKDNEQLEQQAQSLTQSLASTQERLSAFQRDGEHAKDQASLLSVRLRTSEAKQAEQSERLQQLERSKSLQSEAMSSLQKRYGEIETKSAAKVAALVQQCNEHEAALSQRVSMAEEVAASHRKKAHNYKQKLLLLWKRFQDLQEAFASQESARRVEAFQQKERVERIKRQMRSATHQSEEV